MSCLCSLMSGPQLRTWMDGDDSKAGYQNHLVTFHLYPWNLDWDDLKAGLTWTIDQSTYVWPYLVWALRVWWLGCEIVSWETASGELAFQESEGFFWPKLTGHTTSLLPHPVGFSWITKADPNSRRGKFNFFPWLGIDKVTLYKGISDGW